MPRAGTKDAGRVYVRASEEDRRVFEAVASALGLGEISATLRHLAYEKARELGLVKKTGSVIQPKKTRT